RQDHHIYFLAYLYEFARVVVALYPAQVADVDHTAYTCFQLYEYAIRSDVFHNTAVAAVNRELLLDRIPRISSKLLDREAHLALILIQCYYYCLVLFAQLEEFLSIDRLRRPCDLRYVHETFYARHDFEECT